MRVLKSYWGNPQPELFPTVAEHRDFSHLYEIYNIDAFEKI